jgi:hypothetical protein
VAGHPRLGVAGVSEHILKVVPPYFDALLDGSKTFEVRKNDRAYQAGDTLILWEYDPDERRTCRKFPCDQCKPRSVTRRVSFVYSGDPRFGEGGGLQPGVVVLGLGDLA